MLFHNPIIRGYNPDPSVCLANGKYYLVTSSFQYFPGVALFESADLLNWKQIGHCLTRESQLPLKGARASGGIYAPTIRHDGRRFYMITTNVSKGGNFFVHTDDIHGEWSDPVHIPQGGIDPSLYFEDGRAFLSLPGHDPADGRPALFLSEIDIATGVAESPPRPVWHGTGGRYLEGPHLYKIGAWYYMLAAEGGTEYGHMVTYARSKNIYGPYEAFPGNPVLSNRDLGGHPVQGTGHADLFQDYAGNWWLVHLAFRAFGHYHHLGRETFLTPVQFRDDGWFTAGANGTVALEVDAPINATQIRKNRFDFDNKGWRHLRAFDSANYVLEKDRLRLRASPDTLDTPNGAPTFIGLNQEEFDMDFTVRVALTDGEAGVTVYMDEEHRYDLALRKKSDATFAVVLKLNVGDLKSEKEFPVPTATAVLRITTDAEKYNFFHGTTLIGSARSKYLSSEVAGGFTGVILAFYTQNGGDAFNTFTDFVCEYKA